MTSPSSMTSLMGFPIYGVSPSSLDGLFHGNSIYKWMRTGGPFQETSIFMPYSTINHILAVG